MELATSKPNPDALPVGVEDLELLTRSYRKLYRSEYAEQGRKLCLLGLDDMGLADFFDTNLGTLQVWQQVHPEFSEALRRGWAQADANVAQSLYYRALGYNYNAVKVNHYKGKATVTEYQKHMPPSVRACMFWLTSRMPEQWGMGGPRVTACK